MLIKSTIEGLGSLLGIGATNPAAGTDPVAGSTSAPPDQNSPSPSQSDAGTPLPPLGEAARFDISPQGMQAAQSSAATLSGGIANAVNVATAHGTLLNGAASAAETAMRMGGMSGAPVVDDEAAARAWAIRAQAGESSMDMIVRIAKLADRPWPTDKAMDATREAEKAAERKTLAIA